ncbi:Acid phosphatase 1 [Carabus blaptoides fortunei]
MRTRRAGFGQLTNTGKQQHFELGQWLRQRYTGFLPEKYSLNDIYVRSTDVDRTLMSAESNLAGLYSPIGTDVWDTNLKWQPIPVHTLPEKSDAILSGKKHCARYKMEKDKLIHNEEFKRINQQLKPLYEYATNHSGKVIHDLQELEYLYNTLFIENLYKFQLPAWTRDIFPEKMAPWAHLSFEIDCYTSTMQRLKVGLLMNEVFTRMQNKTKKLLVPDRKMWIYSAHDTTVANVLMALGAFEPHCPPYRSMILLELRHSVKLGYYVSAFYKNSSIPRPISIKGCDLQCPLDTVLELMDPIMLTSPEWEDECGTLPATLVSLVAFYAVMSLGILILLLWVSRCIETACAKRQQTRNQLYQPLNDEIN